MDMQFFAAQLDTQAPTIDLHGSATVPGALEQLEKELFLLYNKKAPYARIIHGIGEGVLAKAVHEVIQTHPLVREWREEEHGGSCIILF